MAIEMKNGKLKMNKPIYLGMSISGTSKTLFYEFWYDYITRKYQDNVTQMLIGLLFKLRLKIFAKTLLMILKDGLIHLPMMKVIKNGFQ